MVEHAGKVISAEATTGRGFEYKGNLLKLGTFSPASRNRSRERHLSGRCRSLRRMSPQAEFMAGASAG